MKTLYQILDAVSNGKKSTCIDENTSGDIKVISKNFVYLMD